MKEIKREKLKSCLTIQWGNTLSQEEVYKIIQELGGAATTIQIKQRAKEKFPRLSLWSYVRDRLLKLEKNGYIKRTFNEKGKIVWEIIEEW